MADDVEMTPVAAEPPKVNPFAAASGTGSTVKMNPTANLKPGLKLPTQPGLKPGLKLPTKPGATAVMKPGLRLPTKPGATAVMKPGLKLPTQPGLKPGVRLPTKPVIRKPGATVVSSPLPKPVTATKATAPTVEARPIAATPAKAPMVEAKPIAASSAKAPTVEAKPVAPVPVDAQGVGKLPTVEMQAVDRSEAAPKVSPMPKPLEQLKSVTQKLKGITQDIPQQAILRKTGIIADGSMSEAQKEAAKHKTARISLSDAMGVAPVKNENAPMKTIRIKRPIDIPGATTPLKPQAKPMTAPTATPSITEAETKPVAPATATGSSTITQRKTLKIARPGGGAVRPSGKFGVKRPSQMTTVAKPSSDAAAAAPAEGGVPEIADIPEMPMAPVPQTAAPVSDGPAWLWALSAIVQAAACVAMGALAWFLYQNTQISYF